MLDCTHSSFTPFIPYPHSRHHRSTRTHVLLSLSPHTIRRRHAAASSCTSCVPHGRTAGPTSPGTALLCYSDVFCVCFVRPSAQGRLLLRVLRAFRLLRCVKLFYQLASLLLRNKLEMSFFVPEPAGNEQIGVHLTGTWFRNTR